MFGASAARARFVPSGLRPPFRLVYRIKGESLIEMPPAVSRGRVVFGTHDGHVIGARVTGGSRLWRTDIGGCIASSPAVRDGIVYIGWSGPAPCGAEQGRARRASSRSASRPARSSGASTPGTSSRARQSSTTGSSSPAFRNRSESTRLRDAARREPPDRLERPIASKVASSPALFGRTLYVSAYDRSVYSFDGWTRPAALDDDRLLRRRRRCASSSACAASFSRRSWSEGGYYATPARRVRPRLRRRDRRRLLGVRRRTRESHRWSRQARRLDLRFRRGLARDACTSARRTGRSTRSPRATGTRALEARSRREDPRLRDRDQRPGLRRDDARARRSSSTLVPARSTGGSPTGTTRRSSSRGSAALLVGKGRIYGVENAPAGVDGRTDTLAAAVRPTRQRPRAPRARRAGTARSRTPRSRRRPRAFRSR